jgi:cupin superfamily acireductone dioxygenase involved in methionine salvage
LGKQVRLVLESKPMDFKMLTKKMIETDYKNVVDVWQNEKKEKLKDLLKTHPSVQILKERFSKFNEKIVYDQRIRYIQNGTMFPKFNDKVQSFFGKNLV